LNHKKRTCISQASSNQSASDLPGFGDGGFMPLPLDIFLIWFCPRLASGSLLFGDCWFVNPGFSRAPDDFLITILCFDQYRGLKLPVSAAASWSTIRRKMKVPGMMP
jgi:hypothetical protein